MNVDLRTADQHSRPTLKLAAWTAGLGYEDIPSAVLEHAKLCLLDGLGCGIFGSAQQWGQIAADVAQEIAPGREASLWGRNARAGQAAVALANGTAAHGFEIDDLHLQASFHPGAPIIASVFAVGEGKGISGAELLTAIVAGYEVGVRVGISAGWAHSVSGFHTTGTVGCLAAGAAVARALGLDATATAHALGIAATQASGLYCARQGAMTKRFHAGHAAQSGVIAGMLARRGFTGSSDVLEAPTGGFMSTLSQNADLAALTAGLGEHWRTEEIVFKVYAACASTHTIIDGVDALMKQGLTVRNLESLRIRMTGTGVHNVGWRYVPNGVVAAQMNGFYAAAVKLLEGDAFIDQYRDALLADPRLLDIIDRITIEHDPHLDAGGMSTRHATHVDAQLKGGQKITAYTEQRRGSTKYPISRQEILDKFSRTAGSVLANDSVEELRNMILGVENLKNLNRLCALLRNDAA